MHPLPPKKEVALALLERSSVHVHLDPRVAGVVVPAWFKKQPQLILQIGLNMPVPIPDLRLDESGLSCTLSFNRSPFYCVVPWPSVYAMVGDDGRGMVWPENVPPEVTQQHAKEQQDAAKRPTVVKRDRPAQALGERGGPASSGAAGDGAAKAKKPRKRPRIVSPAPDSRGGLAAVPPLGSPIPAPASLGGHPQTPASLGGHPQTPGTVGPGSPQGETRRSPAPAPEPAPAIAQPSPPPGAQRQEPRRPQPNGASRPKRELPPYLRVVK
jgi:stringent starvation protein B